MAEIYEEVIALRIMSIIALSAGIVTFVFGIILKLTGIHGVSWLTPQAVWRFSVGCVIFAIAFTLYELRDSILKRTD